MPLASFKFPANMKERDKTFGHNELQNGQRARNEAVLSRDLGPFVRSLAASFWPGGGYGCDGLPSSKLDRIQDS